MVNKKPNKEMPGAKTIRLKLKMSGLYATSVEGFPVIRIKPSTTKANPMAMRIRLCLSRARNAYFSSFSMLYMLSEMIKRNKGHLYSFSNND